MCKKTNILFFLIALFVCTSTYAQTNPFYIVTQENVRSLSNYNFKVTGVIQMGNTYNTIYPAYTTFLSDEYELENIPSSKHIQGLPIGFKFPYAGQEFDIYTVNAKGYIVLGKSWEGGMTVYADTLIESATDTIFTQKNKYLISGLYTGKNMDFQGEVSININKGGFEGERGLFISLLNKKLLADGAVVLIYNDFELKETGEINIKPYVQILFSPNSNSLNTYAAFIERDGTGKDNYVYGTGNHSEAWLNTTDTYTNSSYKYGVIRDTVLPEFVTQKPYSINYLPIISNFECPILLRWNPNPLGRYRDSAYIANDYQKLEGDTLETSDKVWWFSDVRDSLRFDVYLGTDEISMDLYKKGIYSDSTVNNFNTILGLVNLPLDSLAAGQKYFIRIHTIHPSGDTTICAGYSFYTNKEEKIKNYCRSEEPLFSGIQGGFSFANLDLNTLHFHPSISDILEGGELYYKTLVPNMDTWTTTLQQGQSYLLQLSTAPFLEIPAFNYIVSVYLDYNSNGDFQDVGEFYYTNGLDAHHFRDITINVPPNAILGKTRLRVVVQAYDGSITTYPTSCEKNASFSDFTITIAPATGCDLSYSDTIISPSCATNSNGAVNIVPAGGLAPYHIQWNTGNSADTLFTLSNLASPARHRATIADAAGCTIRTAMFQITQPAPLQIDTSFHASPAFITFRGGAKPYHVEVTGNKNEMFYAVNDTVFLSDVLHGNYTMVASDKNNCMQQRYEFSKIDTDTASYIQEDFVLYPNPANDYIQISGIDQLATIRIYSSDGKKVFEGNSTNRQLIHLPHLSAALYLVRIEEGDRRKTIKLIQK